MVDKTLEISLQSHFRDELTVEVRDTGVYDQTVCCVIELLWLVFGCC